MKIAIVGAGFVGQTLAKLISRAGHEVKVCNSRDPKTLFTFSLVEKIPVSNLIDVINFSKIIILAVPFYAYPQLDKILFAHKIIIDVTNYYPMRDGIIQSLEQGEITTSEMVAAHFSDSTVVKGFNSIKMADLLEHSFASNFATQYALAVASDNQEAKKIVQQLYHDLGFDDVDLGGLSEGWRIERDQPVYCKLLAKAQLFQYLQDTPRH